MNRIACLKIALMLFMCVVQNITAQEAVNISTKDGSVISKELRNLQKIIFSQDETTMTIFTTDGDVTEVYLLGMSKITFGDNITVPDGIVTPRKTKFAVIDNSILQISCPDGISSVTVYDMSGHLLYNKTTEGCSFNLGIQQLPKGISIVKVKTSTAVVTQKITIK